MTGMSWDEVENTMTMPRLRALEAHWKNSPPLAVSMSFMAHYHGYKSPNAPAKGDKEDFFRKLKKLEGTQNGG